MACTLQKFGQGYGRVNMPAKPESENGAARE